MKTLLNLTAALFSFAFIGTAHATCQGEAQIIASVGAAKMESGKCSVQLSAARFYRESVVCPLDANVVMKSKISLPLVAGESCEAKAGQEVSGVVVLQDGQLSFDL